MRGSTIMITAWIGAVLLMSTASMGHAFIERDLSAPELKTLIDTSHNVFVINPLSDLEFNEGNIPGSVSIPLHQIMSSDKLPADKQTLIVTYCLGPK